MVDPSMEAVGMRHIEKVLVGFEEDNWKLDWELVSSMVVQFVLTMHQSPLV